MADFKVLPTVNGVALKRDNVSATDRLLGRVTAGAGAIEEIAISDYFQTLMDDSDAATARATLGLTAGGAGDIWVEKAGDAMTGNLAIASTAVTGSALSIIRNLTATSTDAAVVSIIQDHASDDQLALYVRQDSPAIAAAIQGDATSAELAFLVTGQSQQGYLSAYMGTTMQLAINRRIGGNFSDTGKAAATINLTGAANDSYIAFYTSSANNTTPLLAMYLAKNQWVGVGHSSPATALHVVSANDWNYTGGVAIFQDSNGRQLGVTSQGLFRRDSDTDGADMWLHYAGYNGGLTRYRNTYIGDGKGGTQIVGVVGATRRTTFLGPVVLTTNTGLSGVKASVPHNSATAVADVGVAYGNLARCFLVGITAVSANAVSSCVYSVTQGYSTTGLLKLSEALFAHSGLVLTVASNTGTSMLRLTVFQTNSFAQACAITVSIIPLAISDDAPLTLTML